MESWYAAFVTILTAVLVVPVVLYYGFGIHYICLIFDKKNIKLP